MMGAVAEPAVVARLSALFAVDRQVSAAKGLLFTVVGLEDQEYTLGWIDMQDAGRKARFTAREWKLLTALFNFCLLLQ